MSSILPIHISLISFFPNAIPLWKIIGWHFQYCLSFATTLHAFATTLRRFQKEHPPLEPEKSSFSFLPVRCSCGHYRCKPPSLSPAGEIDINTTIGGSYHSDELCFWPCCFASYASSRTSPFLHSFISHSLGNSPFTISRIDLEESEGGQVP